MATEKRKQMASSITIDGNDDLRGRQESFAASIAEQFQLRQVALPAKFPFRQIGLAVGIGNQALEVLFAEHSSVPAESQLRAAWKERHGGRAAPVLIVVIHSNRASLCGPNGPEPPTHRNVDPGQAIRLCQEALDHADRHSALRFLRDSLPTIETALPGLKNEGFLASHELAKGARLLKQWPNADAKARGLLGQRGDALLRNLGFHAEKIDGVTSLLRAGAADRRLGVAVLLRQDESPEMQSSRFNGMSPASYAFAVAERENVPYVIVAQGPMLRLYPVRAKGVGQRGRTETYVQIHTSQLRDTDAAYLWLLFSAEALTEGGTLDTLLNESKRFAGELAERLRERIYGEAVPILAEGLAKARKLKNPTAPQLAETYEMAMTVLFRLLFIAYAEDKDLLPYKHSGIYQSRSLKRKAQELIELRNSEAAFDASDSLWRECSLLFAAVEKGNTEWSVPEYDGGLFSTDPAVSPSGAKLAKLSLPNAVFGSVLFAILCIQGGDDLGGGWGPVDFRSLGVREFGTIYEGLLESELSVAETNLTVDKQKFYRPCKKGEEPVVTEGRIYLHNRSGARKSTGSYFTKEFAVEHLLDQALEPALADHLKRIDAIEDADDAAEQFFDFRVADIAMGSGHFLVAAIDRIERAFSQYLSKRSLPGVRSELAKLRVSALDALGPLAETIGDEIEDTQLLRRFIARRCIYGVDLNPISVQLARLAIWIHTFVPGLPLSLLDHNLVVGNSLVGIGQITEVDDVANMRFREAEQKAGQSAARKRKIRPTDTPSLPGFLDAQALLGEAVEPLRRLAHIADATASEVTRARAAMHEARKATAAAEALCDIVTACRMNRGDLPIQFEQWEKIKDSLPDSSPHKAARKALRDLPPFHFPIAFPEVFLRERAGFDVILGNPPWEEVTVEEHAVLARHSPGLRGLNQRQQEEAKEQLRVHRPDLVALYEQELAGAKALRLALVTGPYPGMGTGDPDVYKAFCWRFWQLIAAEGGWIAVVLPRVVFTAKGSTLFRAMMLRTARHLDIAVLINRAGWVFPGVHEQNPVPCLNAIQQGASESDVKVMLRGPFRSLDAFYAGVNRFSSTFGAEDVAGWTDTASFPLLPTELSLEVFTQRRRSPRLDLNEPSQWRARPHTELHATNDKGLMDLDSHDCPRGFWPVFKGESLDLWQPDNGPGSYYAWAEPKSVVAYLHKKRANGRTRGNSVWYEFAGDVRPGKWWTDPNALPCFAPRIAFRDSTNAMNQRTIIAALVPPHVLLGNQAPYILWPRGDSQDEAYLIGILCSLPLDWYSRRFIDKHLNFFILNPFPIPRPSRSDRHWQRCVAIAGRLAAVDDRFGDWAKAVGVDCGPVDEDERFDLICELDAVAAHLYDLEERHLRHIFETFHEGWQPGTTARHPTLGEYDVRLSRTMEYYRQ